MRILWATDIHLNFVAPARVESFIDDVCNDAPDCLLLGGDIGEADTLLGYLGRLETALDRPIYFVLGNHDFYRGSMAGVRTAVDRLVAQAPHLRWLSAEPVVALSEQTALIGHDSWADGRLGNFAGSSVELNDFYLIEELRHLDRPARLAQMQALAGEAAAHFRSVLPQALTRHQRILLLTHVPPFRDACWHAGAIAGSDWLPFFSCRVVGEVLQAIMEAHPLQELTVLCGHTHSYGRAEILPNLTVITGGRPMAIRSPRRRWRCREERRGRAAQGAVRDDRSLPIHPLSKAHRGTMTALPSQGRIGAWVVHVGQLVETG